MIRIFILSLCNLIFFQSYSAFANERFEDVLNSEKQKQEEVFYRAFDSTSLSILTLGAVSTVLAHQQDHQVRSAWVNHQKISKNYSNIGNLLGTGLFSVGVIAGQYFFDERDYVWQNHARGFISGAIAIYTLKTVANRERPGTSRNYQSFPSGHTTIMFMTATQLYYAYGWPAGAAGYALAAFTGATRLADDAHWFSDVVAGAFIGTWIGRATYLENHQESSHQQIQSRLNVMPILSSNKVGTYLTYEY